MASAATKRIMTAIQLENDALALRIRPDHGGKIDQLRSRASGREWLWHNPHLAQHRPGYSESYTGSLDSGGWDEIFPSVSACVLNSDGQSLHVPDHGDLVRVTWVVNEVSENFVHMSAQGRCWPFRFDRCITLKEDGCEADYAVYNGSDFHLPYLWCAHPLLAIEPGMHISWLDLASKEIGRLTVPDPNAAAFSALAEKRFIHASVSEVQVSTANSKEFLRMHYDPSQLPVLGLWINFHGWSGCGSAPYFNLGIEPATAAFDSLCDAVQAGKQRILGPGASDRWRLRLCIH